MYFQCDSVDHIVQYNNCPIATVVTLTIGTIQINLNSQIVMFHKGQSSDQLYFLDIQMQMRAHLYPVLQLKTVH